MRFLASIAATLATLGSTPATAGGTPYVQVQGEHLLVEGRPYYYIGANFWYGMNLGAKGLGGDRQRLLRELDRLAAAGVRNLRIMAGSEGPDNAPYRMTPSLQPTSGHYNQDVFSGLDFLLVEMGKRQMRAILCLSNFWQWSGGFAQYVSWAEGGSAIPYPPQAGWDAFQKYSARFYLNPSAQSLFNSFVATVVGRVNSFNDLPYRADPTIMAWQLANEPGDMGNPEAFVAWLQTSHAVIRSIDSQHLITSGADGAVPYALPDDYLTVHIWPQNAGWYAPNRPDTFNSAKQRSLENLAAHRKIADQRGKPLVLEEFGLARDAGAYAPTATTRLRDDFYATMFAEVERSAAAHQGLAGANFWAWAGEGRAQNAGGDWRPGAPWIGDPPHEPQGWYSVYDQDLSTMRVILNATQNLENTSAALRGAAEAP